MSSLSKIIKEKNPRTKEEKHSSPDEQEVTIDVSDLDPVEKYKCVLFISDTGMNKKVKEQLREFKNVREFNVTQFANRDLDDLYDNHGIEYVWANIKDKNCREWIAKQLPKKSKYFTCISVYSHTKTAKWLKDVDGFVSHSCKLKKLKQQLMALSFGELSKNLEDIDLHDVPSKCLAFLGLQTKLTTQKKTP
jgi:hypothetical protein